MVPAVADCSAGRRDDADVCPPAEDAAATQELTALAAFRLFDPDGSGMLTAAKLRFMCEYLRLPCSISEISDMLQNEFAGRRTISWDTFRAWVEARGGIEPLFESRRQTLPMHSAGIRGCALQSLIAAANESGFTEQEFALWRLLGANVELQSLAALMRCQRAALRHIRCIARERHASALPSLLDRACHLGFGGHMVWRALALIREEAKVIVHIDLRSIGTSLLADSHYRNGFETGSHANQRWSEGGKFGTVARRRWESELFGGAYDVAEAFDRPKYGALNVLRDPKGVAQCRELYGDSYLVLQGVRLRATLSSRDSAYLDAPRLAVPEYCAHVLLEYSDDELREVLRVAAAGCTLNGICKDSQSLRSARYKEVQVHGEVSLHFHVERLVANPQHRLDCTRAEYLEGLCRQHGWTLGWQDAEQSCVEAAVVAASTSAVLGPANAVRRWRTCTQRGSKLKN